MENSGYWSHEPCKDLRGSYSLGYSSGVGYESPVETTNLRNAEESVQIAYYGEENHSLGDSCRLVETLKLCISEEVPVRQDENYPLRPVVVSLLAILILVVSPDKLPECLLLLRDGEPLSRE